MSVPHHALHPKALRKSGVWRHPFSPLVPRQFLEIILVPRVLMNSQDPAKPNYADDHAGACLIFVKFQVREEENNRLWLKSRTKQDKYVRLIKKLCHDPASWVWLGHDLKHENTRWQKCQPYLKDRPSVRYLRQATS